MKKIILILLISTFVTSCKVAKPTYTGSYEKKGSDFTYVLKLEEDSTFIFKKIYYEYSSNCKGRWKPLENKVLLLNCDDEEFPAQMTTGYMGEREYKIEVLP